MPTSENRVHIVMTPGLVAATTEAVKRGLADSISAYLRDALRAQLRRDGIEIPPHKKKRKRAT